ncbi:MAG: DUF3488 domain-containing protein [Candidatus Rokubacteria bacterium]|nr:DUF3488 domain-containing protein [Candidatus Rokubacteria bacterium]
MSIQLAFKVSTYLLVLDGVGALVLGGLLSPTGSLLVLLAVAGSWWGELLRARSAHVPTLWRTLTLAVAAFAVLDLSYLAESLLDGFVHLLLYLTCYKLYNRQTLADWRDLFLLSFFMLVAASALIVSVAFLLFLGVFLALGLWSFVLYHLLTEIERYAPERGALASSGQPPSSSLLGVSLAASVITLAFALAFFFVIPRIGQAALPLKAGVGRMMSGFSDRVELGAFGSIQTDPAVVMRVRFPEEPPGHEALARLRWRGVAFDHFTGQEWRVSQSERRPLPRSPDGRFLLAYPRGGRVVAQEIYLEPIGTDVIFAAPRVLGFTLPGGVAMVDSMDSVSFSVRNARLRYLAYSELEALPPRGSWESSRAMPEEILKSYLQLPRLSPRMGALAREVTQGSRDPYEAALALTAHLRRSFRYSLDLRRETVLPPVEEFLFVTRAGNCEYFAASLAVLLRTLGIPARVVNGFQRGEWNPYGQYLVVRQRDAHSWVEAFFPARGWVTLDPSPRAAFDAAFLTSQLSQYLDALRMRWYRYIVNWSLTDQVAAASALRHQALTWRRSISKAWVSRDWAGWGRWLPLAGAAGAILLLAARLGRGGGRIGLRRHSPKPPQRLRAYEEMLKRLARRALTPGPSETAREFALRAGGALPAVGPAVREITEVYERVRFGRRAIGPDDEKRLLALVGSLAER